MRRLLLVCAFLGCHTAFAQTFPGLSPADTALCNNTGSTALAVPCNSLVINPTPSSLTLAWASTQTADGTPGASNYSGASGTGYALNNLTVSTDDMVLGTIGIGYGWAINHHFGGSNMTGARSAIGVNATLTAADNPSNTNPFYVGATIYSTSSINDGGTNTGAGSRGNIWAINPFACLCSSSATNWGVLVGSEIDVSNRGGTVGSKFGEFVSLDQSDTAQGATWDAAFAVDSGSTAGWKTALLITDLFNVGGGKVPLGTNGCVICEQFAGGPYTITTGIDVGGFTITGAAFRSPSFQVDGSGNLIANSFAQGPSGVNAGVDCTGVTAGTVVVHKGIVTHC